MTSANIETALGVTEVPYDSPHNMPSPMEYSHLHITGIVNNTGLGTAYNAGLHILVYDGNETLLMNVTSSFASDAVFATDNQIENYLSTNYGTTSPNNTVFNTI